MKPPGAPCGGWPGGGAPPVKADGACTGSARTSGKGAAGNRFGCAGGAERGCAAAAAGRAARGALVCTTGPSSNSPPPVRSAPPSPVAARAPAVADGGALSGGAAGLGGWLVSCGATGAPPLSEIAGWRPAVAHCFCGSAVLCAIRHGWATRACPHGRSTSLGTDYIPGHRLHTCRAARQRVPGHGRCHEHVHERRTSGPAWTWIERSRVAR